MFNQYPRAIFRERKIVFSKEELVDKVREGVKVRKQPIMSLYSFREILDKKPRWETVIIDCICWEGQKGFCKAMLNKFSGYPSVLIFDGIRYMGIVFKESTEDELFRLKANTKLNLMILIPGCRNLRTGKKCTIIERNL